MIGTGISLVSGSESRRVGYGLIFGKFMPPTNGHLYLANLLIKSAEKALAASE